MAAERPKERGGLILKAGEKRGHCGTCDEAPKGRVSAEELWVRCGERERGFVRISADA